MAYRGEFLFLFLLFFIQFLLEKKTPSEKKTAEKFPYTPPLPPTDHLDPRAEYINRARNFRLPRDISDGTRRTRPVTHVMATRQREAITYTAGTVVYRSRRSLNGLCTSYIAAYVCVYALFLEFYDCAVPLISRTVKHCRVKLNMHKYGISIVLKNPSQYLTVSLPGEFFLRVRSSLRFPPPHPKYSARR